MIRKLKELKESIQYEWNQRKLLAKIRVQEFKDKFDFIIEFKKEKPKLFTFASIGSIILSVVVVFHGYILFSRLPNAIDCTISSVYTQKIESQNWRFNWYSTTYETQCRYFNGKRWIEQDKVVDVGDMSSTELDDISM